MVSFCQHEIFGEPTKLNAVATEVVSEQMSEEQLNLCVKHVFLRANQRRAKRLDMQLKKAIADAIVVEHANWSDKTKHINAKKKLLLTVSAKKLPHLQKEIRDATETRKDLSKTRTSARKNRCSAEIAQQGLLRKFVKAWGGQLNAIETQIGLKVDDKIDPEFIASAIGF